MQETNILSNEAKEQWIDHDMERESAVATMAVEDAETAINQKQEDHKNTENAGSTSRKPAKSFQGMFHAIGDSLSNLASSNNEEDQDDEKDD